VGTLEVVGEREGAAHARIRELGSPRIENEALHLRDGLGLQRELLEAPSGHRRNIVAGRPATRAVLLAQIDIAALERLELGNVVAEDLVADAVEVVLTD